MNRRSNRARPGQSTAQKNAKEPLRALLLTVTQAEYDAVDEGLRTWPQYPQRSERDDFTIVEFNNSVGRPIILYLRRLPRQGQTVAAAHTGAMLSELKDIDTLILCGICGCFPHNDVSLGDVVVQDQYLDFTIASALQGGTMPRPKGGGLDPLLKALFSNTTKLQERLKNWRTKVRTPPADILIENLNNPDFFADRCYLSASEDKRKLKETLEASTKRTRPSLFYGPGITANVLVKSEGLVSEWKKFSADASHVEMEIGGVYEAVDAIAMYTKRRVRLVPIKAVSDVVGFKKDDAWTSHACHVAAAFTFALLDEDCLGGSGRSGKASNVTAAAPQTATPVTDQEWFSKISPHVSKLMATCPLDDFDKLIREYSQLYYRIADVESQPEWTQFSGRQDEFIPKLCEWILARKPSDLGLEFSAPVGSGKTTLLSLLVLYIKRRCSGKVRTDYINLHDIDEFVLNQDEEDVAFRARLNGATDAAIDKLSKNCRLVPSGGVMIAFIDGLESYERDRLRGTQDRFLKAIAVKSSSELSNCIFVYAVGTIGEDEPFRRRASATSLPSVVFELRRSFAEDVLGDEIIRRFAALRKHAIPNGPDGPRLVERCRLTGLKEVDLFSLDILAFTTDRRNHLARPIDESLSASIDAFARGKLDELSRGTPATGELLSEIAHHVFSEDVSGKSHPLRYKLRGWSIFTPHPLLRSFLRALHIIEELAAAGERMHRSASTPGPQNPGAAETGASKITTPLPNFDLLFPESDNRHAKWLMNFARSRDGREFCGHVVEALVERIENDLERLDSIQRDGKDKPKDLIAVASVAGISHLVYLLGRVSRKGDKGKAVTLLRRVKKLVVDDLIPKIVRESAISHDAKQGIPESAARDVRDDVADYSDLVFEREDPSHDVKHACEKLRLFQCTLLISLINVESKNERHVLCKLFLALMGFARWRETVCSFHLKYYGDTSADWMIDKIVANSENLGPFTRTLQSVGSRVDRVLQASASPEGDPLMLVEMITLCSLAISRKVAIDGQVRLPQGDTPAPGNELRDEVARNLKAALDIVSRVIEKRSNDPIVSLCKLTHRLLSVPEPVWSQDLLVKILELKGTPRTGWKVHFGLPNCPESVAEHVFGGLLFAELLLPETAPGELTGAERRSYDKNEIIRCLLCHEVGEAVIGDWTISKNQFDGSKGAEVKQTEEQWVAMFAQLGILPGWEPQYEILFRWKAHNSGLGVNGTIARTIDKIDALVTLVTLVQRHELQLDRTYNGSQKSVRGWYETFRGDLDDVARKMTYTLSLAEPWIAWCDSEIQRSGRSRVEDIFAGVKKFLGDGPAPDISEIKY